MPGAEPSATSGPARERPGTAIVVLTMQSDPRRARDLLRAGAAAYVLKQAAERKLTEAIRIAAGGGSYIDPELGGALAKLEADPLEALSERERELLRLLALGHTNREIGEQLFLSVRAIEVNRAKLFEKLGIESRPELVRLAIANGVIEPGGRPLRAQLGRTGTRRGSGCRRRAPSGPRSRRRAFRPARASRSGRGPRRRSRVEAAPSSSTTICTWSRPSRVRLALRGGGVLDHVVQRLLGEPVDDPLLLPGSARCRSRSRSHLEAAARRAFLGQRLQGAGQAEALERGWTQVVDQAAELVDLTLEALDRLPPPPPRSAPPGPARRPAARSRARCGSPPGPAGRRRGARGPSAAARARRSRPAAAGARTRRVCAVATAVAALAANACSSRRSSWSNSGPPGFAVERHQRADRAAAEQQRHHQRRFGAEPLAQSRLRGRRPRARGAGRPAPVSPPGRRRPRVGIVSSVDLVADLPGLRGDDQASAAATAGPAASSPRPARGLA